MIRALSLLKVCSHKLAVIKLDGNFLSAGVLKIFKNVMEKLSLIFVKHLSLRNCGISCGGSGTKNNEDDSSLESNSQIDSLI